MKIIEKIIKRLYPRMLPSVMNLPITNLNIAGLSRVIEEKPITVTLDQDYEVDYYHYTLSKNLIDGYTEHVGDVIGPIFGIDSYTEHVGDMIGPILGKLKEYNDLLECKLLNAIETTLQTDSKNNLQYYDLKFNKKTTRNVTEVMKTMLENLDTNIEELKKDKRCHQSIKESGA